MTTQESDSIDIQINGQSLNVPAGCSVVELLEIVAIRSPLVAVEVNGAIIPKTEHARCKLSARDVVEAVTLVGGG
jgi:sulfur carrier protein